MTRERTTAQVAQLLGVSPELLRKWKRRGHIPSAPKGQHGQGRGNECYWPSAAVAEARALSARYHARRKP